MNFITAYHDFMSTTLEQVFTVNQASLEQGAQELFKAEQQHHTIYTFGTGHSHMIGQDLYARAGGYAKVYPIVEIELTLATHPTKSTHIERTTAYADVLDAVYTIQQGDVLIVTSNSGRNPLVVEYTQRAKEKGAIIIAITSLSHSKTISSRHASGLRLFELADVVLNNMAPYGDAGVAIDEDTKMGPISTLSGCFLAQAMIGRFVQLLKEHDLAAPVFRSSNLDGADAWNQQLFDTYILKK